MLETTPPNHVCFMGSRCPTCQVWGHGGSCLWANQKEIITMAAKAKQCVGSSIEQTFGLQHSVSLWSCLLLRRHFSGLFLFPKVNCLGKFISNVFVAEMSQLRAREWARLASLPPSLLLMAEAVWEEDLVWGSAYPNCSLEYNVQLQHNINNNNNNNDSAVESY